MKKLESTTAADIITALTAGPGCPLWVQQAALLVQPSKFGDCYETTAVNFFPEVTVRIPATKTARRTGQEYETLQRRRIDLVGLVQPHYKCYEPFIIGVEIKVDKHDLLNDAKLTDYLPYCHLFCLAVPVDLFDLAWQRLGQDFDTTNIGLLVIKEGRVLVESIPGLTFPDDRHLKEIYAELLLRPFKLAKKECKNFIEFERRTP